MEKRKNVGQKRQAVYRFLAEHAAVLQRQGTVQLAWRWYKGRRLGPFFRLSFRMAGRQHSIYLGTDQVLVAEVRLRLQELRAPLIERRLRDHQFALLRQSIRKHKRQFDQCLRQLGLTRKGAEFRGLRNLPKAEGD
jgi:hypothetical protein